MSDHDWRALLKAVIDDGIPTQTDHEGESACAYCEHIERALPDVGQMQPKDHGAGYSEAQIREYLRLHRFG